MSCAKALGFLLALGAQLFGIFETQFGGLARYLSFRDYPIPRGQQKLFSGSSWQTLELIQVEVSYTFPRPVGFVEELDTGGNACIGFEAVDVQVGVQDFKAVMIDQLHQHGFQADTVQRITLVVDLVIHGFDWGGWIRTTA